MNGRVRGALFLVLMTFTGTSDSAGNAAEQTILIGRPVASSSVPAWNARGCGLPGS